MSALLRQYFDIAFLMGKPQDLPGGERQMRIGVALAFATYVIAITGGFGLSRALLLATLDIGITGLVLRAALQLTGHPGRFEQAFGGYCGAAAFVNAAAIPIYFGQGEGDGPGFADFVLLVWNLCLLGHVIRHTFEVRLATSIFVAFVYVLVLTSAIDSVLPSALPDPEPGAASLDAPLDPRTRSFAAEPVFRHPPLAGVHGPGDTIDRGVVPSPHPDPFLARTESTA